jgi:hypothetical protein
MSPKEIEWLWQPRHWYLLVEDLKGCDTKGSTKQANLE